MSSRVLVIGCGRVGSALAARLLETGWKVVVVDRDEAALTRLGESWEGEVVQGHGFDLDVLEEAGIAEAAAVLAVTSGDNTNIVAAQVATRRYAVPAVAARILDPGRAEFYRGRGFEVVSPTTPAIDSLYAWIPSVRGGA